jgi:hypothetical protein
MWGAQIAFSLQTAQISTADEFAHPTGFTHPTRGSIVCGQAGIRDADA